MQPLPDAQQDRIVYALDGDITAINPDGSARRTLLKTDEIEYQPRWSPDGTQVAFTRGDGALYVMNADGTGVKRVTEPRPGTEESAWSPDGRRVAFSAETTGGFGLYVVNVDGSGLRRVHRVKTGWLGDPAFSPDGRRIAFSLDPTEGGGETDVYVIATSGRRLRRVTKSAGDEGGARWSPDGKRILFGAGGRGIFTVRAGGAGLKKLVGDPVNADTLNPVWSPDGRRIAWTAKFEGGAGSEIHVMNADGTGLTKITDRLSSASTVDW